MSTFIFWKIKKFKVFLSNAKRVLTYNSGFRHYEIEGLDEKSKFRDNIVSDVGSVSWELSEQVSVSIWMAAESTDWLFDLEEWKSKVIANELGKVWSVYLIELVLVSGN